ncbi:hypothetical protein CDAR_260831 [Caerostris darwini]|uniref:Uncharacterized protein n=1 Tax=Caerostris darwini TaxID=1538125 RepID=A0AAV4MEG4_9ARAC|nr:hypothetical protein CDAR_260831 [Caerostris darwini]
MVIHYNPSSLFQNITSCQKNITPSNSILLCYNIPFTINDLCYLDLHFSSSNSSLPVPCIIHVASIVTSSTSSSHPSTGSSCLTSPFSTTTLSPARAGFK